MVCLKENCKRITSVHIRVCILLRVGLLPTGISKLMNVSQSAVTNLRRNLAVKILRNPQCKAEDLDVYAYRFFCQFFIFFNCLDYSVINI